MDIITNKKTLPLAYVGKRAIITAKTTLSGNKKNKNEKLEETFTHKKREYAIWGDSNNDWPTAAADLVSSIGVLSTGIDYRCRTCAGSGVVPVKVTGIDEKFRETIEPYNDLDVIETLRSYWFRRHHFYGLRDLFKFGNTFPLLIFNKESNKIVRIVTLNARHCRMSVDKTRLLVYNDFTHGEPSDKQGDVYQMLDETDPFYDLEWRKDSGKLKGVKALAFPRLKNYFSSSDYYAEPCWDAVRRAGWIDVYKEVPKFLMNAYENAMSLMWHINIPYSYIEEKFSEEKYSAMTEEERLAEYRSWLNSIEENLCSPENANKALMTPYLDDTQGRGDGKWEVTKLDNNLSAAEKLSTSVAANSEILFSLMINPAVFGAGMPGGSYAGNSGSGSDIREAFMVSMVLNYCERQQVLDPVEMMLAFNGHKHVDIKYRSILLSTLDTGHSTEEKIL